jgi:hypothetical protein
MVGYNGFRPSQIAGADGNHAPKRKRDKMMPWLFLPTYILMCFPIYFGYVNYLMWRMSLERNIIGELLLTLFISFFASIVAHAVVGVLLDLCYLITNQKYPKNWL